MDRGFRKEAKVPDQYWDQVSHSSLYQREKIAQKRRDQSIRLARKMKH